jgi:hypothetical protein
MRQIKPAATPVAPASEKRTGGLPGVRASHSSWYYQAQSRNATGVAISGTPFAPKNPKFDCARRTVAGRMKISRDRCGVTVTTPDCVARDVFQLPR